MVKQRGQAFETELLVMGLGLLCTVLVMLRLRLRCSVSSTCAEVLHVHETSFLKQVADVFRCFCRLHFSSGVYSITSGEVL